MRVKVPENLRAGFVSVGLPVYNGARYLRSALDSLVGQDYAHFEIIISDNGSEDETEAICRDYAARNAQIRYYRAERNMGAVWNAVRVYELARGEYFMFAAHDDLRHPQYLSRCVAALDRNPRALLCCTGVRLIDEVGHDISDAVPFRSYAPTGASPRDRLRALVRSNCWLHIYSLIRTRALAETRLGNLMWGGDVVQVAEMCLRGEVEEVPEKLFDYRYFTTKTSADMAHAISSSEVSVSVSWSDLAAELIESIQRSPLGFSERLRLKWMIAVELGFRHPNISWAMREELFSATRRALAAGNYRRAVRLTCIVFLNQIATFGKQVANSARYRGRRFNKVIFPGERAASGGSQSE